MQQATVDMLPDREKAQLQSAMQHKHVLAGIVENTNLHQNDEGGEKNATMYWKVKVDTRYQEEKIKIIQIVQMVRRVVVRISTFIKYKNTYTQIQKYIHPHTKRHT